jgi:hypothetical protein
MTLPRDPDALFARARAELSPSAADQARVLAAITAKLPPPGAGGGGGGGAGGAGSATIAKVAAGVVVAGAIAFAIARVAAPPVAAPITPAPASTPATTASSIAPAESAPGVDIDSLPNAKPVVTKPVASAKAAPSSDALAAELRLVERMHAAEQKNDLTAALGIADEHAREFPNGVLAEEREATRAVVTCKRDGSSRATTLATFEKRFPRSSHEARVTAACGSDRLDP